jgi:pimeloyl-ACP methyl ester carboxylesterase
MASHRIEHTVEDGIERVSYYPAELRHSTPIVMQHGMWNGAWCWEPWQELFADRGWITHAHSLPGHGQSPVQRPIRWCTLDYYLGFLKQEIDRQPIPPVLMGHSMGGALAQWYFKKVADDLPAAVLVAPWPARAVMPAVLGHARNDLVGLVLAVLTLTATPAMRNPRVAAKALITDGALLTPDELHARLGPESFAVLVQHNPLLWTPPRRVRTPMLWVASGRDAFFPLGPQRRSANRYGADFVVVPNDGHGLMIERNSVQTAATIDEWLTATV